MQIQVRQFTTNDIEDAISIWNEIVLEANAFPQEECLDKISGIEFFTSQDYTGIAYDAETNKIVGLYILHPNNIGRCGHICNASYAVASNCRGMHIGQALVCDCMHKAKELGYRVLQFNAVVATNEPALKLYERLGFTKLGTITGGFRKSDGSYVDIIPHFISLV